MRRTLKIKIIHNIVKQIIIKIYIKKFMSWLLLVSLQCCLDCKTLSVDTNEVFMPLILEIFIQD